MVFIGMTATHHADIAISPVVDKVMDIVYLVVIVHNGRMKNVMVSIFNVYNV